MKITIIYDNLKNQDSPLLENGWGFSAYLELENHKLLFDVGWHGDLFLKNCKILKIPLDQIDKMFLTHRHWDHVGGLPSILNKIHDCQIYFPSDYSDYQINEIKRFSDNSKIYKISDFYILNDSNEKLASTGSFKGLGKYNYIQEHALLIKYNQNNDLIMIVGCMHPGLHSFIEASKNFGNVKIIVGGFHDFKDINYLSKIGIKYLHIGHCTKEIELLSNIKDIITNTIKVGYQITIDHHI